MYQGEKVSCPKTKMSLLGAQVYANPSSPLWLSVNGGVITGNVTMTGALYTNQGVIAQFGGGKAGFQFQDLSGAETFRLASLGPGSPQNIIQSTVPLVFTQLGQANGNTQLVTSTVGANADVLTVGGTVNTGTLGALRLSLATGAAGIVGSGTLASGSAIISTTASDVTTYIMLTRTNLNASTAVGELRVTNKGANDFTVNSVDATGAVETGDASSFDWLIISA
jgi:hypothetical protein